MVLIVPEKLLFVKKKLKYPCSKIAVDYYWPINRSFNNSVQFNWPSNDAEKKLVTVGQLDITKVRHFVL